MNKKKNISDYCARFVICVCLFFFIYMAISIFAKNICYDMLGIKNQFVAYFAKVDVDNDIDNDDIDNSEYIKIDWASKYPFKTIVTAVEQNEKSKIQYIVDKYIAIVDKVKERFSFYSEDFIPSKENIKILYDNLRGIVGYNLQYLEDNSGIIILENGYLTSNKPKVEQEEINEIANSVADFNQFLANKDIGFIYVNAGSKVSPVDKQLPPLSNEFRNENGDALIAALEKNNIDTIDMRYEMLNSGLDWYNSYYITDHHWKTETGLWAAGIIAEKLNKDYGFNFDTKLFAPEMYENIVYEDFWYGSLGRRDVFNNSDLESFTLLLPKYETNLSIKIPTRNIDLTGEYQNSIIDMSVLEKMKNFTKEDFLTKQDAYYCNQLRNDALTTISNNLQNNNEGKKILLIQDSFAWYSTSFLATDVSTVNTIYPMAFNGSIKNYVNQTNPDMVVMMYNQGNINAIDWSTHLSAFDLR